MTRIARLGLLTALLLAACADPVASRDDDDAAENDAVVDDDDAIDDDDSATGDDDDSAALPDDDDVVIDDDDAVDCDEDEVCDPGEAIDCPGCPAVSVAVEGGHTCAVREDGSSWCWGRNEFGELGPGSSAWVEDEPLAVTGLGDLALAVAAGGQMSRCPSSELSARRGSAGGQRGQRTRTVDGPREDTSTVRAAGREDTDSRWQVAWQESPVATRG